MHPILSHAALTALFPVQPHSSALGFVLLVTTLFVGVGMLAGMLAAELVARRGSALPRSAKSAARLLAVVGRWPAGVAGAAAVTGLAAAGQWWVTRDLLHRAFAPADAGWTRLAATDHAWTQDALSLSTITSLQSTAALCIAALCGVTLVSVLMDRNFEGRTARARALLIAGALIAPVLAGCAAIVLAIGDMSSGTTQLATWSTWHTLEAGKWAVAGVAACALMGATPIVVGAAAAGRVVSTRLYHGSIVVMLVGLAAWSTSRFATEDIVRGPLHNLETGSVATRAFPDEAVLLRAHARGLDLPRASECAAESVSLARQDALPLVATRAGADMELLNDAAFAPVTPGSELVVVAAVDVLAPSAAVADALRRATQAGAQRVAVVTRYQDHEQTLTLGELRSDQLCVAGWLPMARAVELTERGARWGTVAFAATRAERVRVARATAARR